ncbi:N-6 DNA methylase [Pseudomonas sp. DWP1b1]|uniref:N-6 DNA methylase n=1 Tax=unclassified Pseudomonas TaxID=196821 RepID=UPI003CE95B56
MLDQEKKSEIDAAVLSAVEVFRGYCEPIESVGFTLALLLLKFLSDVLFENTGEGRKAIEDPYLLVPEESDFYRLLNNAREPDIGWRLNRAMQALQNANLQMNDVFWGINFDAIAVSSKTPKDRVLGNFFDAFRSPALEFRGDRDLAQEVAAYACDAVITYASSSSGKRGGEFFTAPQISKLMARVMRPVEGDRISDPFCGVAATLIACREYALKTHGEWGGGLYGQDANGSVLALARMSMILHGETQFQLEWGDTLRDPKLLDCYHLKKFEIVVSHPPFSLRDWGFEHAERDAYHRFRRGVPPRALGDYACISHMVETLAAGVGRMAVLVPLGVLFRGASEQQIRKQLIEENLVDAVIGLPPKLLSHTPIAMAILVLRRNKSSEDVLFIDASRDFQPGKVCNVLRDFDLDKIEQTYTSRQSVARYAMCASLKEIEANDYTLNIARYIDLSEDEVQVDLSALRIERARLKTEFEVLEAKLTMLCEGLRDG